MIRIWLCDSLERIYPASQPKAWRQVLDVARGERFSFQMGVIVDHDSRIAVSVSADAGLEVRIRRAGCVPLPVRGADVPPEEIDGYDRLPGLVPDILQEFESGCIPPTSATAFWISGQTALDCRPGMKQVRVTVTPEAVHGPARTIAASIRVHPLRVAPQGGLDVTNWFYADALCDWYEVAPWDEPFWQIVRPYMANLVSHGQNVIYVPVFTPPLDGVKRPTQLLGVRRVGKDRYEFDWTQVERWIRTAQECGLEKFEWCHLFTQWGVKHAIRIYRKVNGRDELLWDPETPATGPTYRKFLAQFLPQLRAFVTRNKLADKSFFHLSDEPHGDEHLANYRAARALLQELAPWMKVMDALSDIRFAREGLVDTPVPTISKVSEFSREHIPCWAYFCCGPRGAYLNRHLDTPLAKIRMAGWLFHRFQVLGFLHWGYNYWYKRATQQLINPFFQSDGEGWPGWIHGDTFVVYPGEAGPIDSIRWEVFAESLQDYRLLQTLGVPSESLARELKDFDCFPKSAQWIRNKRRKLLESGGKRA